MEEKPHVLIVDDDPLIRRLVGSWVANLNMEPIYAHDGVEGWDSAQRFKPRLILLDYHMPNADGIATSTRLKGSEDTKKIPIIFMTNEDLSPEAEQALKTTGVEDYLHKSASFEEFAEHVKKVMGIPTA